MVACIPIILSAQNAPIQSGMGNDDTGAPKMSLDEPLPGEKMIDRLKLDVQRIIPIHYPADNRNVGSAELMKMVGRAN